MSWAEQSKHKHALTERDMQVSVLLEDYRLLTTSQLQRLLYPSLQKAQTRLLRVYKAGQVERFAYPVLLREGGKGEFVYHLNNRPKRALSAVQHTIQLNEVRVAFEQGCKDSGQVKLAGFIPEYKGKTRDDGRPGRAVEDSVSGLEGFGREVVFIPDAAICLENRMTKHRALFFLEVDMGTEKLIAEGEGNNSVLKKMLLYREYLGNRGFERYSEMFNYEFRGFRVLTVMENPKRIQQIRRELTKRGIQKFIWFTMISRINYKTLFDAIWLKADVDDKKTYSIGGN